VLGEAITSHVGGNDDIDFFLYSNGTVTNLNTLTGSVDFTAALGPNSLNDEGQIVGSIFDHPVLYDNGTLTDLNALVAGSGWTLIGAEGINDSGQIVGYGTNPSGQEVGYLLTPVPEPSGLGLLAVLSSSLLFLGRKRARWQRFR
jgi:hypothetical protein